MLHSNMSKHQNHLKALAKHKLLDLTLQSEWAGLEGVLRMSICNRFPGDAMLLVPNHILRLIDLNNLHGLFGICGKSRHTVTDFYKLSTSRIYGNEDPSLPRQCWVRMIQKLTLSGPTLSFFPERKFRLRENQFVQSLPVSLWLC